MKVCTFCTQLQRYIHVQASTCTYYCPNSLLGPPIAVRRAYLGPEYMCICDARAYAARAYSTCIQHVLVSHIF